mmetsp:Transcript_90717/g.156868  ORF Transcript_90717/g.156868 Transcript_90717/m.156868 type:complete len:97 (+) Transcript_90717:255-545(+)
MGCTRDNHGTDTNVMKKNFTCGMVAFISEVSGSRLAGNLYVDIGCTSARVLIIEPIYWTSQTLQSGSRTEGLEDWTLLRLSVSTARPHRVSLHRRA